MVNYNILPCKLDNNTLPVTLVVLYWWLRNKFSSYCIRNYCPYNYLSSWVSTLCWYLGSNYDDIAIAILPHLRAEIRGISGWSCAILNFLFTLTKHSICSAIHWSGVASLLTAWGGTKNVLSLPSVLPFSFLPFSFLPFPSSTALDAASPWTS